MANKRVEKNIEETKKETPKGEMHVVRIPIDPLNPADKEKLIGVNGKYAKVIRGVETEVSEPVYEVLKNAGLV